jgi:hypothetical protein
MSVYTPAGTRMDKSNATTVTLSNGVTFETNKDNAEESKGFLNELIAHGAPIGKGSVGSYGERHNLSAHPHGYAYDVNQSDWGQVSPAFGKWVAEHQDELNAAELRWNQVGHEHWSSAGKGPDTGHFTMGSHRMSPAEIAAATAQSQGKASAATSSRATIAPTSTGLPGGGGVTRSSVPAPSTAPEMTDSSRSNRDILRPGARHGPGPLDYIDANTHKTQSDDELMNKLNIGGAGEEEHADLMSGGGTTGKRKWWQDQEKDKGNVPGGTRGEADSHVKTAMNIRKELEKPIKMNVEAPSVPHVAAARRTAARSQVHRDQESHTRMARWNHQGDIGFA